MPPKVSVCLITYNHGSYIRKCIDSILAQKVDFDYEIVIGEDKSTDITGAIVREYEQKYPDIISVITPPHNQGGWANFKRTLTACKGDYVAYIEGDDYWVSEQKLQKQVAILDSHPEYSMAIHNVKMEHDGIDGGRSIPEFADGTTFNVKDIILNGWFIAACSMMIRRTSLPASIVPEWTQDLLAGDLGLQLIVATTGDIVYFSEKLGVYRLHSNSVSHVEWKKNATALWLGYKELYTRFNKCTDGKYWPFIKIKMGRVYKELMHASAFTSKIYIDSLFSIIQLGPSAYAPMIKHWVVIHLIPSGLYKLYSSVKRSLTS